MLAQHEAHGVVGGERVCAAIQAHSASRFAMDAGQVVTESGDRILK
jgi:hypothetical protein